MKISYAFLESQRQNRRALSWSSYREVGLPPLNPGDLSEKFHFPNPELEAEAIRVRKTREQLAYRRKTLDVIADMQLSPLDELLLVALSNELHRLDLEEEVLHQKWLENDKRLVSISQLNEQSLDLRLRVVRDCAAGLNYLHSRVPAILHNDVRSPNVFLVDLHLEAPVVAKLADYGLARLESGDLRMG